MVQTDSALAQILAQGNARPLLMAGGTAYEVISARLTASCGSAQGVSIGTVNAAQLMATVNGEGITLGDSVTLSAQVGESTLPLGSFQVTQSNAGEGQCEFTAYDAAYSRLDGVYQPSTSQAPATAKEVLADLCSQCALTLGDVSALTDQSITGDLNGYTCRAMLGYMAALLGCNAVIDRSGAVALRWFSGGRSLTGDDCYSGGLHLESQQRLVGLRMVKKTVTSTVNADGITSQTTSTDTYSAGSGSGLVIEVDNPFATQAITEAVWSKISTLGSYRTGSCTFFGGLETEPGDLVSIIDTAGNTCVFPVQTVTLELDGGCRATVEAAGASETAEAARVQGETGRMLSRLQADLGAFQELTTDNFTAAEAKIDNLYADDAWVGNLFARHIEAESLDISGSSIFRGTLEAGASTVGGVSFGGIRSAYTRELTISLSGSNPNNYREYASKTVQTAPDGGLPAIQGMKLAAVEVQSVNPMGASPDACSVGIITADASKSLYVRKPTAKQIFKVDDWEDAPGGMDTFSVKVSATINPRIGARFTVRLYFGVDGYLEAPAGAEIGGNLSVSDLDMVLSNGSVSYRGFVAGVLTGGAAHIDFTVPLSRPLVSGADVSCTSLTLNLRHPDGGYPWLRSDSSGGTYTQVGSSYVSVWENGASVRSGEVTSITCTNRTDSIRVQVVFGYALAKASGNTAAVTNNVPMGIDINGVFAVSV